MLSSRDMERALELLTAFKDSNNEAEQLTARLVEALIMEQRSSLDLYRKFEAALTSHATRQNGLKAEIGKLNAELTEARLGKMASDAQEQRIQELLGAHATAQADLRKRLQDAVDLSEQRLREISELEDEKAVLESKLHQAQDRIAVLTPKLSPL